MPLLPKRWIIAPEMTPAARRALAEFGPILGQILFNRGIADADSAHAFLAGEYIQPLDPMRMIGMPAAVDRLRRAITKREKIAVYGDYDADGVTATALLVTALGSLDADVRHYIPNRFDEGYGLNAEALRTLKEAGVGLVVTVDCGIRSLEEAAYAKKIALDLIISDHHHVGNELPDALAVINPKQPGDAYPEKGLAGVGLAYKIAQAVLRAERRGVSEETLLDLVALGTVADLAPLTGENRALVRRGLKAINQARREGLKSLLAVSRIKPGEATATTLGYLLGPRLNAAGRLESALAAYELLTTNDVFQATQLAAQLEQQNRERQRLTAETHAKAREIALAGGRDAPFLFAAHSEFSSGIVGLAAARLTEEFYRPAAVGQIGEETTRGSARSIPEFHITEALDRCRHLLERHGGHAAAAGFTVHNARREALAEALREAAAQKFADGPPQPSLAVDAVVPLASLDEWLVAQLQQIEPTGYGNPAPVLAARDIRLVSARRVGADGSHLKMQVSDGNIRMDCIAFRQGERFGALPHRIDLAFTLEMNEWNGERRVQLNVKDVRPTESLSQQTDTPSPSPFADTSPRRGAWPVCGAAG